MNGLKELIGLLNEFRDRSDMVLTHADYLRNSLAKVIKSNDILRHDYDVLIGTPGREEFKRFLQDYIEMLDGLEQICEAVGLVMTDAGENHLRIANILRIVKDDYVKEAE